MKKILNFFHIPINRNISKPNTPAVFHWSVATDAFGNSLCNNSLFQFFIFFNRSTSFFQNSIDFIASTSKKGRNSALLTDFRQGNGKVIKYIQSYMLHKNTMFVVVIHIFHGNFNHPEKEIVIYYFFIWNSFKNMLIQQSFIFMPNKCI